MTYFQEQKLIAFGAIIGVAFTFIGFYMVKSQAQQPDAPKSNFEVVDTYSYENRTCSVIRYTTPSTTWQYFLDCKEVKK
jgi:dTDP-glucose pyrophosphorylase